MGKKLKKIRTRNQQKEMLTKLKQDQLINSYVRKQRKRIDLEETKVKKIKPLSFLWTVFSFPLVTLLMFQISLILSFIVLFLAVIDLFKFNK